MAKHLELVIRCKDCGAVLDTWDVYAGDPATHVCEIAGDLNFDHDCPTPKASPDDEDDEDDEEVEERGEDE